MLTTLKCFIINISFLFPVRETHVIQQSGLGDDYQTVVHKEPNVLKTRASCVCAGFGRDRVNFLHISQHGAMFGFVLETLFITQGFKQLCGV